jgi:hypothetical protein
LQILWGKDAGDRTAEGLGHYLLHYPQIGLGHGSSGKSADRNGLPGCLGHLRQPLRVCGQIADVVGKALNIADGY